MFFISTMETVIGKIYIASSSKGLSKISFDSDEFRKWLEGRGKEWKYDESKNLEVARQLNDYFNGALKKFEVDLDIVTTDFQRSVYDVLMKVPYGQLVSYKDIAVSIHCPRACRAVGGAVHRNPVPIIVPCHRVINSNGTIGGFAYDIDLKKKLLRIEGVVL
ncbi:methylated-DNA-[protein]-cysteine S-methyltransferase [Caldanaerobius fijiensis DSM 17918]|uniref:Methylated-DNA--protein-cysteine methyltransferase n=1 Tax=Caldanaerobius fijiensis DSM 17918 TaxID=1121256 RepID=A0A1M4T6E6_9THEO|nr:methylated-DNA--[protein]-cysteine S-methyltransferase [Caldanaerobius fijiensis]SHE40021.1 methylated-DNA-[protein]-cysteine S-methyltransferase [Caldanaerobius fijiensis DSM 17918]